MIQKPKTNNEVFQMGHKMTYETTHKAFFSPESTFVKKQRKIPTLDLTIDNIYRRKKELDPLVPTHVLPRRDKIPPPISTHSRDFQIPGFDADKEPPRDEGAGLSTKVPNRTRIQYGSEEMANRVYHVDTYKRKSTIFLPQLELYKRHGIQKFMDDPKHNKVDDQAILKNPVNAKLTIPVATMGRLPWD